MKSDFVSFSRIILWRKSELGVLLAQVRRVPAKLGAVSCFPEWVRVIFNPKIRTCFPLSINHSLGLTEYQVGPVVHLELRTTPS